ncbi:hypothetical protein ACO0SA_002192 [Hanseniaspora valbyensis]
MSLLNTISVDITKDKNIINYPILGDILIEIQGDLEIEKPNEPDVTKEFKFGELDFTLHINEEQLELVKKELNVEKEDIDLQKLDQLSNELKEAICKSNDKKECTIYIGTKQRLIGKLLKLPEPLAVLEMKEREKITINKVIKYKFKFVDRPLPIM